MMLPYTDGCYTVSPEQRQLGERILREGKAACLLLAGGQGSRLGGTKVKGMMPVSVVLQKSLFQIFCERALFASHAYGKKMFLGIMTSSGNHEETVSFLEENCYFGLDKEQLFFFQQEDLPLRDKEGHILYDARGNIEVAPNGNGRALHLFYERGFWEKLHQHGVEYLQIVPIDNALADPFDRDFLGFHVSQRLEASIQAVERKPGENVGVLVQKEGKVQVVEYSEWSENLDVNQKKLLGNTGLYCFSFAFIASLVKEREELPLHMAWKCRNPTTQEKVGKSEFFLFDVFSYAKKTAVLVRPRKECFSPLKQKEGIDSLDTVKRDLQNYDQDLFLRVVSRDPPDQPFELSQAFRYPIAFLVKDMHKNYKNFVFT